MPVDVSWRIHARCRGEDALWFFPPGHVEHKAEKDARELRARAICAGCPVRDKCLDYALTVEEPYGIWGGLNEMERRRLLRRRAS